MGTSQMDRVSVCDNEKFLHKDGGDGCTAVYNELWTEKMVKMVIFCYIDFPTIQRKRKQPAKGCPGTTNRQKPSHVEEQQMQTQGGRMNGNDSKYLDQDPLQNSAFCNFVGSSEALL